MPVAVFDSVATGVIRVSQNTHILPLYITIQLLVYSWAESPETNSDVCDCVYYLLWWLFGVNVREKEQNSILRAASLTAI